MPVSAASTTSKVFAKPSGFELPTAPPRVPISTMGKCVAAWTGNGLAYVLVLEGGDEDYNRLIRRTSQVALSLPLDATLCATRTV